MPNTTAQVPRPPCSAHPGGQLPCLSLSANLAFFLCAGVWSVRGHESARERGLDATFPIEWEFQRTMSHSSCRFGHRDIRIKMNGTVIPSIVVTEEGPTAASARGTAAGMQGVPPNGCSDEPCHNALLTHGTEKSSR